MNYIKKLQSDLEAKTAELAAKIAMITAFQAHIASAKFQGTDADGSRKDWISTADVGTWLRNIKSEGL